MADIIIIHATDPDGSIFQSVKEVLGNSIKESIEVDSLKNTVLSFPGLIIQTGAGIVLRDGFPVRLNYSEFSTLCHLARHPGIILSKEQLYTAVYGESRFNSNTVPNTICRIRSKIESDPRHPTYIKTVIGLGYKFEIPSDN